MTALISVRTEPRIESPERGPYRALYTALVQRGAEESAAALRFLREQLQEAAQEPGDLPGDPGDLHRWAQLGIERVGRLYQDYLQQRRAGADRYYFTNRAHALYFLQHAAPTKLVDGAWLYGLLRYWRDPSMAPLIRIYCEELGDGRAEQNHVLLYQKLVDRYGCAEGPVDDEAYRQGAVQLALAYNARDLLPEIVGFNLGYEQLPLHLLITAYELQELGLDPYYFTLHITIDNLGSGHAKKSIDALLDLLANADDPVEFYRRVANGYRLNAIGKGTAAIIENFDLRRELEAMLTRKSVFGQYMHSDRCRIGGRTLSEWLTQPQAMSDLLDALESEGWIRRHQDPANSRFWALLHGTKPKMFGVFTLYEQQLLFDWIAGDYNAPRQPLHARSAAVETGAEPGCRKAAGSPARPSRDTRAVAETLEQLIDDMAPGRHHTARGLLATRRFTALSDL